MAARRQKTETLRIDGETRVVVHRDKHYWVEQRPDGRLAGHAGVVHTDFVELVRLASPLPCSVCGEPAYDRTPRARVKGLHPMCGPTLNACTEELADDALFNLAAALGASVADDDRDVSTRRAA